jgi:4-carboxymuconolactone decarboxylase
MSGDDAYQKGLEVMDHLMGAAGRDAVVKRLDELDSGLARLIVEHCFGKVWTRPGLDMRSRSLITMTTLAALNRGPQLRLHIRGALNLGIPEKEIVELLVHVGLYAGLPVMAEGLTAAREVFEEHRKAN